MVFHHFAARLVADGDDEVLGAGDAAEAEAERDRITGGYLGDDDVDLIEAHETRSQAGVSGRGVGAGESNLQIRL